MIIEGRRTSVGGRFLSKVEQTWRPLLKAINAEIKPGLDQIEHLSWGKLKHCRDKFCGKKMRMEFFFVNLSSVKQRLKFQLWWQTQVHLKRKILWHYQNEQFVLNRQEWHFEFRKTESKSVKSESNSTSNESNSVKTEPFSVKNESNSVKATKSNSVK